MNKFTEDQYEAILQTKVKIGPFEYTLDELQQSHLIKRFNEYHINIIRKKFLEKGIIFGAEDLKPLAINEKFKPV